MRSSQLTIFNNKSRGEYLNRINLAGISKHLFKHLIVLRCTVPNSNGMGRREWNNHVQGNRGEMRKIHVTRQFFEASGRHGDFFEKTKNPFLDKVYESMCTKFQVCIFFRLARRRDTDRWIHTYIHKYTHIQVNLGISYDRLLASRGFW